MGVDPPDHQLLPRLVPPVHVLLGIRVIGVLLNMTRIWTVSCAFAGIGLVLLIGLVLFWSSHSLRPDAVDAPGDAIHLPIVCNTPLAPPRVSWQMPRDVEGNLGQKNF